MTATAEVTAIATRPQGGAMSLASAALTIQEIVAQKQLIAQAMKELMHDGEHYGVIPGTSRRKDKDGNELPPKPSLWKPGADLLCSLFQLDADYLPEEVIHEPGYIYYRFKCVLTHIPSGKRVCSGVGSCNSREESFTRPAPKKCPKCGKDAIKRSKFPDRDKPKDEPGWYCHAKVSGCGANFRFDDKTITEQDAGIPDPSDLDNAILKRATKRARVDAVLTATGASDFFTQDAEDLGERAKRLFGIIDVEGTDPEANQAIRGAIGEAPPKALTAATSNAPSAAAGTATSGSLASVPPTGSPVTSPKGAPVAAVATPSAATTSSPKPSQIKHDGTFANHKQVTLLHVMKSKLGIKECKGDCVVEKERQSKWGKPPLKVVTRCTYHTQLAAFKDCDGRPITTSKDLSEAQISNLLDRYDARLKQDQETRAADMPNLAVIDEATPQQLEELRNTVDGDEARLDAICETLRVMSITDIVTKERVSQAMALSLAWGTNSWDTMRKKIMGLVAP